MIVNRVLKATAALLFAGSAGVALAHPTGTEITINGLTYAGSGCPIGSATANISADGKAFTLIFDEFAAEAGPNIPRGDGRKFCQINLDIHIPQGWQYSLFKVDFRGYAGLDNGARGELKSRYYFTGVDGQQDAELRTVITGPYDDNYIVNDVLGVSSLVWSRCGINRAINIVTDVSVRARRSAEAYLTVDSVDGEFVQKYYFQWKRC